MLSFLLLLILPHLSPAASSLEQARLARALLGPDVWARLVEVENVARKSVYPPTVYALVFELGGLLWFYTDTDGTQSLSLHEDDLAKEKADLAPLLREIEPGFVRYRLLPDEAEGRVGWWTHPLKNGCFVESVAALRERVQRGELIRGARLLSFYLSASGRLVGHTVLLYETPGGTFVYDPAMPGVTRRSKVPLSGEALALARSIQPDYEIMQARWVPTTMPRAPALLTAVEPRQMRASARGRETTAVQ